MWTEVEQALHQSTTSVMTGIARLLPGTIAFVVSVLVAALIGFLLAWVVRRLLVSLDFDNRIGDWGAAAYAGWRPATSPTRLLSETVWWVVLLLGVLGGVAAFDPMLTSELMGRLFGSVMNLVTAVVLLVAGNLLARFFARGALISLVNMNVPQARLISLGVKWMVVILATAMALEHLSIGGRIVELAFGILFGGIVLTLALGIGLHSKDIAAWSLMRPPEERTKDESQTFKHL